MNVRYSKLKELIESDKNGRDWFNSYQELESFIFNKLDERGLDFPLTANKPEQNAIEAIKWLLKEEL